jgi:hypothetical protein
MSVLFYPLKHPDFFMEVAESIITKASGEDPIYCFESFKKTQLKIFAKDRDEIGLRILFNEQHLVLDRQLYSSHFEAHEPILFASP